jgi:phage baseplate assembly protein W
MATQATDKAKFLGIGWGFPIAVDSRGGIRLARYDDDIKEAIRIILGTALGERVMRPDFGCAASDLVFEPIGASLTGKVEFYVRNALDYWEPRIEVNEVKASADEEKIIVDIRYTVRSTNRQDNMVYPFYRAGAA